MGAAKILPYYTFADWERWEGSWELIEGMPFAMSPAPMPKHQRISGNLYQQFNQEFENCKSCKVYQAIDWLVDDDTILQPDVLVVCEPIKHRLNFSPELVIEILSPATALKDRNNKFHIYQSYGVKYYIIIDAEKNTVEIYENKKTEYILIESTNNTFSFLFENNCTATIDFTAIWE